MKENYIKEIQNCGNMFFIAATGGGTSFIGDFLKTPGGSKCIAGGYVPYAVEATNNFVGGKLDKYADANAARRLAVASYEHCLKIKPTDPNICVGVGIACSLVKDNERDGREHHINIAVHTYNETFGVSVVFKNSKLNRSEEEEFVNDLTLFTLAKKYCKNIDREWEIVHQMIYLDNGGDVTPFGEYNRMVGYDLYCEAIAHIPNNETIVIYPGSYNPLHQAHKEIYALAHKIVGLPVFYELSVKNSYKPSMDYVDLENRYEQFNSDENWINSVIVTTAPRFVDKVELLKKHFNPKQIIIVTGADTWERVYDDAALRNGDIKFFEDNNVKFLVFGRSAEIKNQDSTLFIKNELALNYNNPISSSEIRKK